MSPSRPTAVAGPEAGASSVPCDPVLRSLASYHAQGLSPEVMVAVANPRVIYADYDLILEDFRDHLGGLLGPSAVASPATAREAIDSWLASEVAYVSKPQASQTVTNTPIPTTAEERVVHRPPRYGRAAVICGRTLHRDAPLPIFDVKGCGVPHDELPYLPNSNGLMTLEESIWEVLYEKLVSAVFRHSGLPARPIPSYAIVDLGFDALFLDRPCQRATLLVRRAFTRPKFQWGGRIRGPASPGCCSTSR